MAIDRASSYTRAFGRVSDPAAALLYYTIRENYSEECPKRAREESGPRPSHHDVPATMHARG